MTTRNHVFLIQDFERVCRGEASLETSGLDLHLSDQADCFYLAFEHGRVCVVTVRISYSGSCSPTHVLSFDFDFDFFQSFGLHIITIDRDQGDSTDLAKIMLVQPFVRFTAAHSYEISCLQLTDRRVYFTWDDAKRRRDITLFKDEKNTLDPLSPGASSTVEQLDELWDRMVHEFSRHYHTLIRGAAHVLTNYLFLASSGHFRWLY